MKRDNRIIYWGVALVVVFSILMVIVNINFIFAAIVTLVILWMYSELTLSPEARERRRIANERRRAHEEDIQRAREIARAQGQGFREGMDRSDEDYDLRERARSARPFTDFAFGGKSNNGRSSKKRKPREPFQYWD